MISRQAFRLLFITALVSVVLIFDGTVTSSASAGRGPTAPSNLTVTAVTETTISVSWSPSSHTRSFSYRVRLVDHQNSQYNAVYTVGQTQTTFTATYLVPEHDFTISVYAVDSRGNRSADSNTVNVSTLGNTTPPTVPVLQATVLGPSQVQLTWMESTDNLPFECCFYSVFANGNYVSQHVNWAQAPAGHESVVLRHLTPGTAYTFKVRASDFGDSTPNVAFSNEVTVSTDPSTDVTPPTRQRIYTSFRAKAAPRFGLAGRRRPMTWIHSRPSSMRYMSTAS